LACAEKSDGGGKRRLSSKRASIACVLMLAEFTGGHRKCLPKKSH